MVSKYICLISFRCLEFLIGGRGNNHKSKNSYITHHVSQDWHQLASMNFKNCTIKGRGRDSQWIHSSLKYKEWPHTMHRGIGKVYSDSSFWMPVHESEVCLASYCRHREIYNELLIILGIKLGKMKKSPKFYTLLLLLKEVQPNS